MISEDLSPDVIGREVEVFAIPDSSNAEEWKDGKFKVRDIATCEEITVAWTQFYFRKQDAEALSPKQTATALVKEQARRGQGRPSAYRSSATTSAKRAKAAQKPSPKAIFQNRKFVFTSATRDDRAGHPPFNKSDCRAFIEQRGGTVIDDFKGHDDDDEVYLIADTHYRTLKYLSGLSLSVPCVHHTWITECARQDAFVNFKDYMLPAGRALGADGAIHEYEWKPQKGRLMTGKKVWIYSKNRSNTRVTGLAEIWSPILSAVGAEVACDDDVPQNELDLRQWITSGGIDIVLTDASCEPLIVEFVEASSNAKVVGSEWVVEALITGELPDATNARYRHNA